MAGPASPGSERSLGRVLGAAAPLAFADLAFGLPFGTLARDAGLPTWQVALMSALVFAGSAQVAALSVVASGGSAAAAVLSGAFLNLRYGAMGAAVAQTLTGGRLKRFLVTQLVTDESYALSISTKGGGRPDPFALVVSGLVLWATWVAGSTLGAVVGPRLGDPARWGLDVTFPATFAVLLVSMLARGGALPALAGIAVAAALVPLGVQGLPLAGAILAGMAVTR